MKVNMPMVVTAADVVKRTLTGTIVTWNEHPNNAGKRDADITLSGVFFPDILSPLIY